MKNLQRVLITGVGGPAGQAAVQYFQYHNFYVIGVDMNENINTTVNDFFKVYPANNPVYVPQLLALAVKQQATLLVPTVSEELPEFSLNRYKFLQKGIQVYISPGYPVHICHDKCATSANLEAKGVAVPNYAVPYEHGPYLDEILSVMAFPILAKPRISRGGRGIKIYNNREELMKEDRKEIIFQEFAPGEEYDLNLCIDSQAPHHILASQVLVKTSLKNGNVGNAETVKRVDEPEVQKLGEQAAKALGLTGPLDIDIRKNADGKPVLLEINARLGANCLTTPEVLDALVWMWRRDIGNNGNPFIFADADADNNFAMLPNFASY